MIGFHPLVAGWFLKHVGKPMPLQEEAWPAIAAGKHVLFAAYRVQRKAFSLKQLFLQSVKSRTWASLAAAKDWRSPREML